MLTVTVQQQQASFVMTWNSPRPKMLLVRSCCKWNLFYIIPRNNWWVSRTSIHMWGNIHHMYRMQRPQPTNPVIASQIGSFQKNKCKNLVLSPVYKTETENICTLYFAIQTATRTGYFHFAVLPLLHIKAEQEDILFLLLIPWWFILFHEASWVIRFSCVSQYGLLKIMSVF